MPMPGGSQRRGSTFGRIFCSGSHVWDGIAVLGSTGVIVFFSRAPCVSLTARDVTKWQKNVRDCRKVPKSHQNSEWHRPPDRSNSRSVQCANTTYRSDFAHASLFAQTLIYLPRPDGQHLEVNDKIDRDPTAIQIQPRCCRRPWPGCPLESARRRQWHRDHHLFQCQDVERKRDIYLKTVRGKVVLFALPCFIR